MYMNVTNDWIWCQYSPGAGGKIICALLQLSNKVHPWHSDIHDNFQNFIRSKILISHENHLRNEMQAPYQLSWFTRQLPFTRGDNLDPDEIDAIWMETNKKYEQLLTMHWCKPYFPNWFQGRAVRIVNDSRSMDFLRKRRDPIFYEWKERTVYFKRFIPEWIYNNHLIKKFNDDPEFHMEYENKSDFYKEHFYENPEIKQLQVSATHKQVLCNINLSDMLTMPGSKIAEKINSVFDLDINLEKADLLLKHWLDNNKKFID